MKFPVKQLYLYCAILTLGGGLGFWASRQWLNPHSPLVSQTNTTLPQPIYIPIESELNPKTNVNFIAKAVLRVSPAVVRIDSLPSSNKLKDSDSTPFFHRFFDNQPNLKERRPAPSGTGSGFIITADGGLITNAHVVGGAPEVRVTLQNGQSYIGKVLGSDQITDVAVVKIAAKQLPVVPLGSTDKLIPGEWAIAIGNPLGLDNTVTVGIISAIGRSSSQVGIPNRRVKFIQTDAAINPGNSGGPLLNAEGKVIGVNTAIRADAQGLGFAIPIETAYKIAQQLLKQGKVEHPYLGVELITLNAKNRREIAKNPAINLPPLQQTGALIIRVMSGSPAAKGGLQPGDLILKVGGVVVPDAIKVQEQVEKSQIGKALEVEIIRRGKTKKLKISPQAMPIRD